LPTLNHLDRPAPNGSCGVHQVRFIVSAKKFELTLWPQLHPFFRAKSRPFPDAGIPQLWV
jgi:hypothetical protein